MSNWLFYLAKFLGGVQCHWNLAKWKKSNSQKLELCGIDIQKITLGNFRLEGYFLDYQGHALPLKKGVGKSQNLYSANKFGTSVFNTEGQGKPSKKEKLKEKNNNSSPKKPRKGQKLLSFCFFVFFDGFKLTTEGSTSKG